MQEKAGPSPKRTAVSSRETPRGIDKGAMRDRDTKTRGDEQYIPFFRTLLPVHRHTSHVILLIHIARV